jgi:hypothetical protein
LVAAGILYVIIVVSQKKQNKAEKALRETN